MPDVMQSLGDLRRPDLRSLDRVRELLLDGRAWSINAAARELKWGWRRAARILRLATALRMAYETRRGYRGRDNGS